ncbi:class I adenylate-forming enzyme family protein [Dechloromonas sp. HYN0024]|uniref:class I adenylate-forming enzyme family protein n=1 Tax=Dechloromonas sp. HYN0024 TaxID=2231055 RepID=UPI000E42E31A|nr:AMP-binding protein [Dechloromonas sp. HYN0024]AXS79582.1 AMP-dependent synthetase [Dechloromonas sp. HYN0024]
MICLALNKAGPIYNRKLMASPSNSLANHLQQAAAKHPLTSAWQHAGESVTFAALLKDIECLAARIASRQWAIVETGNSLHLARHAYACSYLNRPFFPLEIGPSIPAIATIPDQAALIIATSGSEGTPRAVVLGQRQLDAAAAASNALLPLHPGDIWLNCLPLYHIGGQAILWRCARASATMLLHNGFAAEDVAADLDSHPVTHISLVPAMLARLLDIGCRPPASLRVALIGGAALAQSLYDKAVATGWPLYPSYGMSETAAQFATFKPADGPWHAGLVGQPMPGHDIRIGENGRLAVRGPQVMAGYIDGSGIDADGWLTTGDLARIDSCGSLTILGRADDMLISGGRNVHPQEIESCLAACPGVVDVAVTGQPDPVWGDLIVALIVGPTSPSELLAYARQHLPSAALPRRVLGVSGLPRTPTGKLERPALRRLAAEANS